MAAANIDPQPEPEAWDRGSRVFGCFWDTANNDSVTRTEYICLLYTSDAADE